MIDTVKFLLRLSNKQYNELLSCGLEIQKNDNETGKNIFRFVTKEFYVGSFDRRITVRAFSSDRVEIEFSLPKFLYGHNVYLLYQSQIKKCLIDFHRSIASVFPSIPDLNEWQVVRLDLCYAWKFLTEEHARQVLTELQKIAVARKKARIYPNESVMFIGDSISYKFYMKKPEFYYHDFRELKKTHLDLAFRTLDTSAGVLRFETTLRKKYLKHEFKRALYFDDLVNGIDLKALLNKHFKKVMRGVSTQPTEATEALDKLSSAYKPSKARALWTFWLLYFSKDLKVRNQIRNQYHRQTTWSNLRDIGKAGVGIPKQTIDNEFELSIPSHIVVNHDPVERAAARRQGGMAVL